MFVRIETGFKAEFSDPEANRIHRTIAEIHPALAEKIRWVRRLDVYWIELAAPRDKVVGAITAAFKNPVTEWLFTGDLLPSAAGKTGTLYDLMQESPNRPGKFYGLEKRQRLSFHDEKALLVKDALQTILQRRTHEDRVVTGELILLEGVKLTQADLEWIAKYWFSHEKYESWSLLSEDELKRNSRFQNDQVAKYLNATHSPARSRLLQFRDESFNQSKKIAWDEVNEKLKAPMKPAAHCGFIHGEEWNIFPEIKFASAELSTDAQTEVEFHLAKQQLEVYGRGFRSKLQTVLGVLPEKNRLWMGEIHGNHPIRVRDEFEKGLKRVSETTATPIVQMKVWEDSHESEPSYFWSSTIGLSKISLETPLEGKLSELLFVGHFESPAVSNLTFVQTLKSVIEKANEGAALEFVIPSTGLSLLQSLKSSHNGLRYGADVVIDDQTEWFKQYFEAPLPLSFIWGVREDKRDWVMRELRNHDVPFFTLGTTTLSGEIRIIENGEARAMVKAHDFFDTKKRETEPRRNLQEEELLDDAVYLQEKRVQPAKFKNRFSVEELLLKPETYHVSVSSPVIIRPSLETWTGVMVLSDLCGQEFDSAYMEYLFRKCSAIGGQIHSIQVSMLNGLRSWKHTLDAFDKTFGIQLTQFENEVRTNVQAHWLALQLVAKIGDIRTIRSEDFKHVHDRIYWLAGGFDSPATRWLSGTEGRYQSGIQSAVAIENTPDHEGMIDTLTYALLKHRLGAEVKLQHHFHSGFVISLSENERFTVEEEWKILEIESEFIGRVTSSPFLVIRDEKDQTNTISIEDLL
jgi:hypothetical protein